MKTKEEKSQISAIVASLFSVMGYTLYFWKNLAGVGHPNISSWAVFSFLGVLNFSSYKKLTGGWVKSVFPAVNTALLIILTLLILRNGSFRSLSAIDWSCLSFGTCASLCWWVFNKKGFAPALVQIILETGVAVAFVPTILSAARNSSNEIWLAWLLWTFSFFTQFLVVRFDWRGKYIDFLFPLNRTILNGLVFIFALI